MAPLEQIKHVALLTYIGMAITYFIRRLLPGEGFSKKGMKISRFIRNEKEINTKSY
ncbi:MAG TPA: hypothetical protein VKR53_09245 [Puia sp.]|nr:hypothetical protein [Puia sp.]